MSCYNRSQIYNKLGCDMDEWSVFPAVNELCQSELSTLPLSSIKQFTHHHKTQKENATSHISSQKNVMHECWLSRILAYLHTHANTHIYYTSYRSPDFSWAQC